jgi:hypothetical protein
MQLPTLVKNTSQYKRPNLKKSQHTAYAYQQKAILKKISNIKGTNFTEQTLVKQKKNWNLHVCFQNNIYKKNITDMSFYTLSF